MYSIYIELYIIDGYLICITYIFCIFANTRIRNSAKNVTYVHNVHIHISVCTDYAYIDII